MNKRIVLNLINEFQDITQRKLAEKLDVSLGKINLMIKELENDEIIIKRNGYYLTEKGKIELKKLELEKINSVVILAAGRSKDFNFPNGFLEIDTEALIERSIRILLDLKIETIYIVVGYRKEYYKRLSQKYKEISLIENDDYGSYSSFYSFSKLKEYIKNDFLLLDSDIIYEKKAIKKILDSPEKNIILASSETGSRDEAYICVENEHLIKMSKDKSELKKIDGEMLGISKISYEYFKNMMELEVKNPYYSYEYAIADIAKKIPLKVLKINELVWGEVDNKEQYQRILREIYPRIKKNEELEKIQEIKKLLISILDIKLVDIDEVEVLGGMTNKNYLVTINRKKYVLRIPGFGTENMINRYSEKINAKHVSIIGIDKELVYFNDKTGIKVSEYIEKAETLNPETSKKIENILLTSNLLRKLHTSNIQFENKFDVFSEINKYENLIKNRELLYDKYSNYLEVRKEIFNLKQKLLENGYKITACHNDTVPENFIKNDKGEIFLIDWEYSGMNDPMWDLAAHSLESNFSKVEEQLLLKYYFNNTIKKEDVLRIKIYKVLQDFLWSVWTILKEENGDDFGSYGLERYNRSKKILKEIV
ncbi:phosphotransferase [Cetobacterium sp. 8H]|uniref:phosphocholine cytidylyltransferase/choline kinase family protein n=1 Tax=Cetobacterium sp. 8H TaxID=2759681 RepID=UPI00163CC473|nr:phosphocholine cytidylyltransferase/choline kinase family protein [Cetobacterium sp. 8H]MBC2850932.1 phosphotransferase [Cetobacterium sp. 8H]